MFFDQAEDPLTYDPSKHTYDALVEEPALWIDLANLVLSEEAIAEFANRYGHFGIRKTDQWIQAGEQFALGVWSLRDIRRELNLYQRTFNNWHARADDASALSVLKKLNEWATPVLRRHYLRYVLAVDGVIPSAWLQLAIAMDESRTVDACKMCPKVFEIKPQGPRRQYCSEACKKRYQRSKKKTTKASKRRKS